MTYTETPVLQVANASTQGILFFPEQPCALNKILVIEDDANLTSSLARSLRRVGYDVVSSGDGAAGLDLARVEDPDLVLLDLGLPRMHGFKVLHELRMLRFDLPVVIITGDLHPGLELRAEAAGVRAVFRKPFDSHALLRKIRELLDFP